ncbi:hypothetical protein SRHO_G00307350 [Serrasalmus rhombeus]
MPWIPLIQLPPLFALEQWHLERSSTCPLLQFVSAYVQGHFMKDWRQGETRSTTQTHMHRMDTDT